MKKILFSFLVFATQFLFSQKSRNIGDFNAVKAYDKISVQLIHSNENSVEIIGNENDVEIVNKNGELKIRMIPTKILQGDGTKVKVYFTELSEIQASQGSRINSNDVIESENLNLTSNEGSSLDLQIDANNLNIKANSGATMNLSGKVENQNILVNSGAKYFGKKLDSENAVINSNAGGNAEVNVSGSVTATTRAGGIIDVYGNPDDRQTKNILGGKINFK